MTPEINNKHVKWYRNPSDRFLIEFECLGERKRYTTDNLTLFVGFLLERFPEWRWMNVYYRWQSGDQWRHGQIASYTPHSLPSTSEPTAFELERYRQLCERNGFSNVVAMRQYRLIEEIQED